jgi:hypothetical protein
MIKCSLSQEKSESASGKLFVWLIFMGQSTKISDNYLIVSYCYVLKKYFLFWLGLKVELFNSYHDGYS